jgi:streptomycin 3"-adenylyltransferase
MVLAQARQQAIPLFGQKASKLLPEIPLQQIRQAMRDMLPALLEGLRGDERNVLLTLARIWRTASTGEFVPKNAAAAWAIPLIPDQEAATLDYARRAYLGEIVDDWVNRSSDAKTLAEHLLARIMSCFGWLPDLPRRVSEQAFTMTINPPTLE